MPIPILDNHIPCEPFRGRNVDAVRDFERQGGTHLIISHLPYEEISTTELSDFKRAFDLTVSMKDRVNKETHEKAYATVGPYPGQLMAPETLFALDRTKEHILRAFY